MRINITNRSRRLETISEDMESIIEETILFDRDFPLIGPVFYERSASDNTVNYLEKKKLK